MPAVEHPPESTAAPEANSLAPAQTSTVFGGMIAAVVAWAGLIGLISNTLPTVPNRWLFFALLQIALTGTVLPFVRFLSQRFSRDGGEDLPPSVMLRQAGWFALWGTTCAWLLIPRLLNLPVAVALLVALVVIEVLLRLRETTGWRPR
ncbi:MAG: hypothetical protein IT326_03425 [Anaerolineae bacterium]|nr:hypothetical protein [Anaerolineae bacterium]